MTYQGLWESVTAAFGPSSERAKPAAGTARL